jgi:hypothetical protein
LDNPDNRVLLAFFFIFSEMWVAEFLAQRFDVPRARERNWRERREPTCSESMFPVSTNQPVIPNRRAEELPPSWKAQPFGLVIVCTGITTYYRQERSRLAADASREVVVLPFAANAPGPDREV